MSYTAEQVMRDGRRVKLVEREDGTATEVREIGGILFQVDFDRDGYRRGSWCMGKAARASREYGIDLGEVR